MKNEDRDALLTALYVKIDDELEAERWMGCPPQLSDAELVTLAVAQALLGFRSEARWLRFARKNLAEMAGWAGYGYCASHTRFFWGLRLYLVCTPTGMPILWALANPKLDEREVLQAMLDVDEDLVADRPGLLIIADKGFASKEFENDLVMRGAELLRPSFKREKKRKGEGLLKSVRQLIESVNDTLKGQLDLEQHGGRTFEGVAVRVAQRILAMAAAIGRNHKTGAPSTRSLAAFDH